MKTLSRREFFLKAIAKDGNLQSKKNIKNSEVIVGRIADFPVGEKKILTSLQVVIESFSEGLRAQSIKDDSQFYSIKSNQTGELIVNYTEIWPANQAFSILTNSATYFDTQWEDRS